MGFAFGVAPVAHHGVFFARSEVLVCLLHRFSEVFRNLIVFWILFFHSTFAGVFAEIFCSAHSKNQLKRDKRTRLSADK